MKIELDENHKYSVDGKPYPGVTEILGGCGIIDDTWYTEQSAIRGTHIHKACQYIDEGCLDRDTVDPLYLPYLMAYEKFLDECRPSWDLVEFKVFHKELGYCGTLDRWGSMFGFDVLIDLKSGTPQKWVGCQLFSYDQAVTSMALNGSMDLPLLGVQKRYGLYLSKDGTYTLKEYDKRNDWRGFTAALNVWKWKHNK
jgi:hypothetical protein